MIDWFARNEVAANLLMVVILLLGGWALVDRIPLEVFPSFDRDTITISTTYRGATPIEIEASVVVRIEEAVAGVEGIKSINSISFEGVGRVIIELEDGEDRREMLDEVKGLVEAISTFPEGVESPTYQVQSAPREVISVAVSGELPEDELRRLGEQVRDDLVNLPEVTQVELNGVRPYEIAIEISPAALQRYGVTLDQVVTIIQRNSRDLPAGSIRGKGLEILLRTSGQAYGREAFADIPIYSHADGSRLTLGDIATIRDGFDEDPLYAQFNGRPAVMLEVYRTGMQNALEIGDAVKAYVKQSQQSMPQGVTMDYWRDRSRIIKLRLNTLLTSAWQGGILVFICLTLFLRLSVAVWVCVGIPISFMGAIALLPELGVTFNLISLFAFILVLGIVVDDAIITGENVYTHLKREGQGVDAVIRGAQEVSVPVTFGLLTTVVAFVPLMFMQGDRGPIFAQIPLIVIPVLLFSWVESKLILPAHLRHIHIHSDRPVGGLARIQHAISDGLVRFIHVVYQPTLEWMLRYRYLTLSMFVGFSIIIISLVISGHTAFTFFPRVQSETARATLSMQPGTAEAVTQRHILRMRDKAVELQQRYTDPTTGESVIHNILASVGWQAGSGGVPTAGGSPELGQVSLELIPPEERTLQVTTSELVSEWRRAIGPIPGASELNFRAEIGRGGDPISIQLRGDDFEILKQIATRLRERIGEYPGVFDIKDSFEDGKPEIQLHLRPEADLLGLSVSDLGTQVRNAFFGAEAQRFQRGRDDVRVVVRYPAEERDSITSLESMMITTAAGIQIPIGNVTDIDMDIGFSKIQREDRQRVINVSADANKGSLNLTKVGSELQLFMDELLLEYPGVHYTLGGEMKEQAESFGSLFYGSMLMLFAIYALLAVPLRSYLQPIVVMLVIPFSLIGAILGHVVMDIPLSIASVMGMLALAGVVVNDSLVLTDWINRRRREGVPVEEAVRKAGVARFRAILLTSITTFAGLVPLLMDQTTQAQFLIPMAVSLGFGILYATFLSLVLVPVGYLILEDGHRLRVWLYGEPQLEANGP